MKTIKQAASEVPVWAEADVIVCGGGAAGFMAAISAARAGARTLLVERYGILGGTATAGCMVEFGSIYNGRQVLIGGATHEFLHRLVDYGGAKMRNDKSHNMTFDPESMIQVCQEMVLAAGVELVLHTLVVDAVCESGRLSGIVVENKSGRGALLAGVIIDATGDGDVARRAGAAFDIGDENGALQPVTLELLLGGVDLARVPRSHYDVSPLVRQHAADWPIPTERIFSWGAVPRRRKPGQGEDGADGRFFINATNVLDIDGTKWTDLTRAEIEARRQVDPLVSFMQRHVPGFENCYLERTGVQVGIRETRHIRGEYLLSADDVLGGRHFADGVVSACNSIDVHDVKGRDFDHEFLEKGAFYEIPYRCFVPRGLDGLLVTGRALSADHRALGSARVMVVCMPAGEACGIAGAMTAERRRGVRDIDLLALRNKIRGGGTVLSDDTAA